MQEADRGGEGPSTPDVERFVSNPVQGVRDGQHVLQLEATLKQALLRVTEHGLSDQDSGHGLIVAVTARGLRVLPGT